MNNRKICKGSGSAKGMGCGEKQYIFRYGLCKDCFIDWCFNNEKGKEYFKKTSTIEYKKIRTEKHKETKALKLQVAKISTLKSNLQDKINLIVRLIDKDKGCISCDHGWNDKWTRQAHAGHRLSVGAFPNLRYNLFNIFKQCSICNSRKGGNERGYDDGLIEHYGIDLFNAVSSLKGQYKVLRLQRHEILDLHKKALKIIKNIKSGINYTHEMANEELGIYL